MVFLLSVCAMNLVNIEFPIEKGYEAPFVATLKIKIQPIWKLNEVISH